MQILTFSESVNKGIEKLTQLAKSQSREQAKSTRASRNLLSQTSKMLNNLERSVNRSAKTLTNQVIQDLSPPINFNVGNILASDQALNDYIIKNGFGTAIKDYTDSQNQLINQVETDLLKMDDTLNFQGNYQDIQINNIQSCFDDIILPDVKKNLRDIIQTTAQGAEISATSTIFLNKLRKVASPQKAEIITKISEFGRDITSKSAQEAGIDHFLYFGPSLDGITRPFCSVLVGKVYTKEQIDQMNNQQTYSVLKSCGGYRCRHNWTPVSMGYIKSAGLKLGTDQDVQNANMKAKS